MVQNLENIIISTLKEFNPEKIGIFGSFARNENTPGSDLDILVKFKDGITLLQLIKLENSSGNRRSNNQ